MSDKAYKWRDYTIVQDLAIRLDEFMSKIGPVDPVTGCQYQTHGATHYQGYMMHNAHLASNYGSNQTVKGLMVTGHRVIARLKFKRPLTPQDKVYHTCGDMRCLNPDHIEIGSYKEIQDMMTRLGKRRVGTVKGPHNPNRTTYTIPDLFWLRDTATTKDIMTKYGLNSHAAWQLKWSACNNFKWLKDYNPDGTKK